MMKLLRINQKIQKVSKAAHSFDEEKNGQSHEEKRYKHPKIMEFATSKLTMFVIQAFW